MLAILNFILIFLLRYSIQIVLYSMMCTNLTYIL